MKVMLLQLALSLLGQVINLVSPMLRESLGKFAADLYLSAKKTDNAFDDLFAAGLLAILGLPTPVD